MPNLQRFHETFEYSSRTENTLFISPKYHANFRKYRVYTGVQCELNIADCPFVSLANTEYFTSHVVFSNSKKIPHPFSQKFKGYSTNTENLKSKKGFQSPIKIKLKLRIIKYLKIL